jgi:hypothetical protein
MHGEGDAPENRSRSWTRFLCATFAWSCVWPCPSGPRLPLGAFSTLDSGSPFWLGLTVGGLVGFFFGLVFGGNRKWRVWDYIFGPEDPRQAETRGSGGADKELAVPISRRSWGTSS